MAGPRPPLGAGTAGGCRWRSGSLLAGTEPAAASSSSAPSTPATPPTASAGSPSRPRPTGRSPWTGRPNAAPAPGGSPHPPQPWFRLTPHLPPQRLPRRRGCRLHPGLPGHRRHGHLAAGGAQHHPLHPPGRLRRRLQRPGEAAGDLPLVPAALRGSWCLLGWPLSPMSPPPPLRSAAVLSAPCLTSSTTSTAKPSPCHPAPTS